MLPSSQIIKKTAKNQLKSSWVASMVVAVILMLTVYFAAIFLSLMYSLLVTGYKAHAIVGIIVSVCYTVVVFFTVFPLLQGALRWFWFLGLEKQLSVGEIFYYYSDSRLFLKSIFFYIVFFLRCIVTVILCALPSGVIRFLPELATEFFPKIESYNALLQRVSDILLVLGLAAALVVLMKYFTAPMLISINEDFAPEEALSVSKQLGVSRKSGLVFIASFIGWILLSFLGITLIYTIPYFIMSYAVAVRFAITNHRYEMSKWGAPPLV